MTAKKVIGNPTIPDKPALSSAEDLLGIKAKELKKEIYTDPETNVSVEIRELSFNESLHASREMQTAVANNKRGIFSTIPDSDGKPIKLLDEQICIAVALSHSVISPKLDVDSWLKVITTTPLGYSLYARYLVLNGLGINPDEPEAKSEIEVAKEEIQSDFE